MLGPAILGVMLVSVSSQDLIGVNYSFDVDFERTFNNKTCDTDAKWKLTDYSNLNIASKPRGSFKGIKSERESCTSSFPIVFFDDSVLELNIFIQVITEDSGLKTTIFDERRNVLLTYSYNKSTDSFTSGWSTVSIPINTNITGYINLKGRSHDNEIVLVDSFRTTSTTSNSMKRQNTNIFLSTFGIDESDDVILENMHEPLDILPDNEGSGECGNEITDGSGYGNEIEDDYEETDENDIDEKGITRIEE